MRQFIALTFNSSFKEEPELQAETGNKKIN